MTLRNRLWVFMGLFGISTVAVAALLTYRALDLKNAAREIETDDVVGNALYLKALSLLVEIQSNTHDYLSGDVDDIDDFHDNVKTLDVTIQEIESIEAEEIESVRELRHNVQAYQMALRTRVFKTHDPDAEATAIKRADNIEHQTGRTLLDAIRELNVQQQDRIYQLPNRNDISLQQLTQRL
ncbi:MAG: hypothetical protein AAGA56_10240, partial [Myxococcota bacterium]